MITAFFYGMVLALGLILPLGAQNMFIMSQGMAGKRFVHALPAVITASLCDTFLILLASLGVSLFILAHPLIEKILLIVGILFLCYLAIHLWRSAELKADVTSKKSFSAKKQILFCASVSILNPHAILDTVAVIGTNAMLFKGNAHTAFTAACILVSWLWFIALALFGKWACRFTRFTFYLNRFSALIILLSAASLFFRLIKIFS